MRKLARAQIQALWGAVRVVLLWIGWVRHQAEPASPSLSAIEPARAEPSEIERQAEALVAWPADVQAREWIAPRRVRIRRLGVRRIGSANPDGATLQWHFRGAILERLDEYFVCIKRLKQHDPEAYRTFSRLGFAVAPDLFNNPRDADVRKHVGDRRATYGGVLLAKTPEEDAEEFIRPSFVYFRKLKLPFHVQAYRGDVYELNALYDNRRASEKWRSKFTHIMRCHIGMAPDGTMRLLKEPFISDSTIQPGRAKRGARQPQSFTLKNLVWRVPSWVADVAEEKGVDPEEWATEILVMVLSTYTETLEKIVIRVKRDGVVAAFGIELPRAKYFFKDRESTALAKDGRRKRIFHSVIAHKRQLTDHATDVRSHYRGLRSFDWNASRVHIVLPHMSDVMRFDVPLREYKEGDPRIKKGMTEEQAVTTLEGLLVS